MSKLEKAYQLAKGSEEAYKHKQILFIGSESYDAPTITILQGLQELGFTVLVIGHSNINSWFCETLIKKYEGQSIDFILSNLHWGTRWDYYENQFLPDVPKVLIDGDDNCNWNSWRKKFENYSGQYKKLRPNEVPDGLLKPYRYVVDLGDYQPDIIFTAQKVHNEPFETIYLPFGVHREYFDLSESKGVDERWWDISHFIGPGIQRRRMHRMMTLMNYCGLIQNGFSGKVRGEAITPKAISEYCKKDDNVHSYHRWILYKDYFKQLNNSKIVLYPGIDHWPFWDSKRPWEAMACGALVMMKHPVTDVSQYPITEIIPNLVYSNIIDFTKKVAAIRLKRYDLNRLQSDMKKKLIRYFTPQSITRYFLSQINDRAKV